VTALLRKWNEGDAEALEQLMTLVYKQLQRLARRYLGKEHPDHSMLTGTLVHEAFLRFRNLGRLQWNDRNDFFRIAARNMRQVLVDQARKRRSGKRGHGAVAVSLDDEMILSSQRDREVIAVDEALERMETELPDSCRLIELRYFAGLTIDETAQVLNISSDRVKHKWRVAKLWLRRELENAGPTNGSGNSKTD
jgi:RNA polymerase sigma factor (TIGR02999 family)